MALVRVVIPTFNRASLVKEAIESVLAQTLSDFEIMVIDDGSTDDTEIVVNRLAASDSRIKYLKQANSGVARARNRAIQEPGTHTYVAFLDSDDLWCPLHLEMSVSAFECVPTAALVFSRRQTVDICGLRTAEDVLENYDKRLHKLMEWATPCSLSGMYLLDTRKCRSLLVRNDFAPCTSSVVLRRSAVQRIKWFRADLEVLEDVELYIYLSWQPFVFIDSVLGLYRYYGDNLTACRELSSPISLLRQRSVARFCRTKLLTCESAEDRCIVSSQLAGALYLVGQCCAVQSDLVGARKAYQQALIYEVSFRLIKGYIASLLPSYVQRPLKRALTTVEAIISKMIKTNGKRQQS